LGLDDDIYYLIKTPTGADLFRQDRIELVPQEAP